MEESGTKLHQLVENEAARAEAEPDDEAAAEDEPGEAAPAEAEPEAEPEAPPGPAGGLTPEAGAELEKATTAYYRKVAKVFGGELPPECPNCAGLGFDLTGGQGLEAYAAVEQFKGCDTCNGLGKVATGSKVQGHDVRDCPTCQGRGYLEKLATAAPPPEAAATAEYGTPAWMGSVPAPNAAAPVVGA